MHKSILIIFFLGLSIFLNIEYNFAKSLRPNKNIKSAITIKGELRCGSDMCNIGDEYDIPFPINGVELFDVCKDGDDCEIRAVVDGKTVLEIISAKKLDFPHDNVQYVNATETQNVNQEDNFGLYGFTLNKNLAQILQMAKDKNFNVTILKNPSNENDVNLIINISKRLNLNMNVNNISQDKFNKFINDNSDMKIDSRFFNVLSQYLKINFIPVSFEIPNKAYVLSLYIKDPTNNNFLPYSMLIIPNKEYTLAAEKIMDERADKREIIDQLPVLYKDDAVCKIFTPYNYMKTSFLFYSPVFLHILEEDVKSYNDYLNENARKREQNRLQQLQDGM